MHGRIVQGYSHWGLGVHPLMNLPYASLALIYWSLLLGAWGDDQSCWQCSLPTSSLTAQLMVGWKGARGWGVHGSSPWRREGPWLEAWAKVGSPSHLTTSCTELPRLAAAWAGIFSLSPTHPPPQSAPSGSGLQLPHAADLGTFRCLSVWSGSTEHRFALWSCAWGCIGAMVGEIFRLLAEESNLVRDWWASTDKKRMFWGKASWFGSLLQPVGKKGLAPEGYPTPTIHLKRAFRIYFENISKSMVFYLFSAVKSLSQLSPMSLNAPPKKIPGYRAAIAPEGFKNGPCHCHPGCSSVKKQVCSLKWFLKKKKKSWY